MPAQYESRDNGGRVIRIGASRILEPADGPVVVGADTGFVKNFDVIALSSIQRQPARTLFGLLIPLAGSGAAGRNGGAQYLVRRFAIIRNPKLGRIACGQPEIIITRNRRRNVAADAFAVIGAVTGDSFEVSQEVGQARRGIDGDIRNVNTGNAIPDFACY